MPRPQILTPLFRSLRSFKGVGPQLNALLTRFFLAEETLDPIVLDLLMHMPAGVIDRRRKSSIAEALPGQICTLKIHVDAHMPAPRSKRNIPHRVKAHDESGDISLVYFGNKGGWVERALPKGEGRYISGEIEVFNGQKQMVHPHYVVPLDKFDTMPLVEPVYPLTHGLSSKILGRLVKDALATLPNLDEWIESERLTSNQWPSFREAMTRLHHPKQPEDLDPAAPPRMRLAYDEYLAGQLTLQVIRSQMVVEKGVGRVFEGVLASHLTKNLPYTLTDGQQAAIAQINEDLISPNRMSRLLQGDVGAGKTIVALMAMLGVVESGAQAAIMAPTELLASQHFATINPFCEQLGVTCLLVTGKMNATARREAHEQIENGTAQIVIGTHALFQSGVRFAELGLSVVDEQHRFGVHQRLALSKKGARADLLVMTATPIPRTLVLTHFGDMAVSLLTEKPAGRQPIDTAMIPFSQYERVSQRLVQRIEAGAQAYWVCPLVEESENVDLVSAEDRYQALRKLLGPKVGLIHGRMSAAEKQMAMDSFIKGDIGVLVATTVIEVGVDVPSASIMIIEHAERFGLAQLHQLRGRVGRGAEKSACLLIHSEPLGETAGARLRKMCETEDGFKIAEADLRLRGSGDVLGTRQSGMPGYKLALPDVHKHLLEWAHEDAARIFLDNPGLTGKQGEALRALLYTFRRDLAIPLIRAG